MWINDLLSSTDAGERQRVCMFVYRSGESREREKEGAGEDLRGEEDDQKISQDFSRMFSHVGLDNLISAGTK